MRARQVEQTDFADFDLILAADKQNLEDLKRICPTEYQAKLALILDFCDFAYQQKAYTEVPDPYYGAGDGFELVLDLLENSCDQLVRRIQRGRL